MQTYASLDGIDENGKRDQYPKCSGSRCLAAGKARFRFYISVLRVFFDLGWMLIDLIGPQADGFWPLDHQQSVVVVDNACAGYMLIIQTLLEIVTMHIFMVIQH